MLMMFYTVFLLSLTFLMAFFNVNDPKSVRNLLLQFLIYLPLYGRVLEWW